jgi:hypothetical protein
MQTPDSRVSPRNETGKNIYIFPVTSLGLTLLSGVCIAAIMCHGLSSDRGDLLLRDPTEQVFPSPHLRTDTSSVSKRRVF